MNEAFDFAQCCGFRKLSGEHIPYAGDAEPAGEASRPLGQACDPTSPRGRGTERSRTISFHTHHAPMSPLPTGVISSAVERSRRPRPPWCEAPATLACGHRWLGMGDQISHAWREMAFSNMSAPNGPLPHLLRLTGVGISARCSHAVRRRAAKPAMRRRSPLFRAPADWGTYW